MDGMETLEFIIHPDGRVEERVSGIIGSSCEAVTEAIEDQVGQVVTRKTTSDFYAQSVQSAQSVSAQLMTWD